MPVNLASLDDQQRAAALHGDGAALVVAGAGAGKTRVLTHRIARLVESGIPPESIFTCTFTKKATGEMQKRLGDLIGARADRLRLGTIHSICYALLREYWRANGERSRDVMMEGEQALLCKMICEPASPRNQLGINLKSRSIGVSQLLRFVSAAKEHLWDPDDMAMHLMSEGASALDPLFGGPRSRAKYAVMPQEWVSAYQNYEAGKRAKGKVDFEDMALLLYQAWQLDPGFLKVCQERVRYLLVDEFQDTSLAQWEVMRLLCRPRNNIFVVGDDYQSLYGFRGAKPEFLINFEHFYPEAAIYPIDTNYRSMGEIVSRSLTLVKHNEFQRHKDLRHNREGIAMVNVAGYDNEVSEADGIAQSIRTLAAPDDSDGTPVTTYTWSDFAVVYRTNAYSAHLELAMIQNNIPYQIVGGQSFFALREVADVLAYLRLSTDPKDRSAFRRAASAPARYLSREFFDRVNKAKASMKAMDAARYATSAPHEERALLELDMVVRYLPQLKTPKQMIGWVRAKTNYDSWYLLNERGSDDQESPSANQKVPTLDALEDIAAGFDTPAELLAYADLVVQQSRQNENDMRPKVSLLTVHKSKGLEWPVVFVAGCCDALMPHAKAVEEAERPQLAEEEERRIAYVAVTRAADRITMCYPRSYRERKVLPSPFIGEMGLAAGAEFVRRDVADADDQTVEVVVESEGEPGSMSNVDGSGLAVNRGRGTVAEAAHTA